MYIAILNSPPLKDVETTYEHISNPPRKDREVFDLKITIPNYKKRYIINNQFINRTCSEHS